MNTIYITVLLSSTSFYFTSGAKEALRTKLENIERQAVGKTNNVLTPNKNTNGKLVALIILPSHPSKDLTLRSAQRTKSSKECTTEECRLRGHFDFDDNKYHDSDDPDDDENYDSDDDIKKEKLVGPIYKYVYLNPEVTENERTKIYHRFSWYCNTKAAYMCKKACRETYKEACDYYQCGSRLRRKLRRGCKYNCARNFIDYLH